MWFPLCFLNFDSHHDGIVLTTVNQLKISLTSDGPWPFNQYGSVWAFPYLLVSFAIPHEFLLVGIRLLTVCFYIGATYFLYKSTIIVFNLKTAQISVFLYLVFQPFLGPWNTSLLPWPSSLVTLLVALICFLIVNAIGSDENKINRKLLAIGFCIAIILGSRLQIGILMLLSLSFAIVVLRIGKVRFLFLGSVLWLIPWTVFLQSKGWFIPSLYDSVVLGAQFLGSDHLHYPLPVLSVIAGVFLFVWLELALASRLNKFVNIVFLGLVFMASLLLTKRILGDSFIFSNYLSVTQRKTLAALFFCSLIILSIEFLKSIFRFGKVLGSADQTRKILFLLISICSAAQAWPFFDQMHIWWSFAPILVFLAERLSNLGFINEVISRSTYLLSVLFLMLFLVVSQFTGTKTQLNSIDQKLVFVSTLDERNELEVQDFIREQIPIGSEVLNLCPNAYPFFKPGLYKSESRFFVYWSNFESAPISYKDFNSRKVSFVLDCNTYLYQGEELSKYQMRKQAIIDSIPGLELIGSIDKGSFQWRVYSTK